MIPYNLFEIFKRTADKRLDAMAEKRYIYGMKHEGTRVIKCKAPRCGVCYFPAEDDPDRTMVSFINSQNDKVTVAIKCPNIVSIFGRGCLKAYEPEVVKELVLDKY